MGGVNNIDKYNKVGGSFMKQAHFKTWYQMGLLGIFYFMSVNSRIAWNMSADDNRCEYQHFKLQNWKFCLILAEQMIAFKDEHAIDLTHEAILNNFIAVIPQSSKILMEHHRLTYWVCQLEEKIQS